VLLEGITNSSPSEWKIICSVTVFDSVQILTVVALVITQNVLSYIEGLLDQCVNAIWAHRDIQNVKSVLVKQRHDVNHRVIISILVATSTIRTNKSRTKDCNNFSQVL